VSLRKHATMSDDRKVMHLADLRWYYVGQHVFVYRHWSSKVEYIVEEIRWKTGQLVLQVAGAYEFDDELEHELDTLHGFPA
jgi:hypothetical protein